MWRVFDFGIWAMGDGKGGCTAGVMWVGALATPDSDLEGVHNMRGVRSLSSVKS